MMEYMATMVVAVSGSASGIGAALRHRLEEDGHRVIGIDLRDAEVTADLAEPAGRAAAIAGVRAQAGDALGGVVACAGVGPHTRDWPGIVSLDYFGAAALLAGLRDAVAQPGGAAVAVSSNSSTISPVDEAIVRACLAGDEAAARTRAAETDGQLAYASAKRALALFVGFLPQGVGLDPARVHPGEQQRNGLFLARPFRSADQHDHRLGRRGEPSLDLEQSRAHLRLASRVGGFADAMPDFRRFEHGASRKRVLR